MCCFVRFFNNTTSPVISILIDEKRIFSDIIINTASTYSIIAIGTREITVLQNTDKTLLTTRLSLYGNKYYTIIIFDDEFIILQDLHPTIHKKSFS